LVLRDASGLEISGGNVELQLPANGQIVRTIDELFPDVSVTNFPGTLTVIAEGGTISATVVQMGGEPPELVVLPVSPLR